MTDFRLETERLVVRDWRDADWPAFFAHTNTPTVMRWLGGVMGGDKQHTMRTRLASYKEQFGHTLWLLERKRDGGPLAGEVLGFCGLKRSNQAGGPQGEFEIGWRLREDAWGKGYAREAAEASLRAGFEEFGAPQIIALTVQGNTGSWGLMKRLGMARRPDMDFYSTEFVIEGEDVIVYAITREEWQASQ